MDKFKYSMLPESLRGVLLVYTGQAGAGKTLATLLDPNNTFFIDADHAKGREMASKKPKMRYRSINSSDGENIVKAGENFIEAIKEIDKTSITTVVIDNIFEVQEGVHAWIFANPVKAAQMYNLVAKNISSRSYGHDIMANDRLIKGFIDELLQDGITVIITTHMKPKFQVTGQWEAKIRRWVYEAASLYLIMIRTGSAPDALVFKNAFNHHLEIDPYTLSKDQLEKYRRGELESCQVYSRLPRRIPAFTPTKLYRYLARTPEEIQETPYGPGETLDEDEMAPYIEILTKQQIANVEKIMDEEAKEAERYRAIEENIKAAQRVKLEQFIRDNPDMDMADLIREAKVKFELFASQITPVYVMKARQ